MEVRVDVTVVVGRHHGQARPSGLLAMVAALLSSCAAVDAFSDRSNAYNRETLDSRTELVVSNIMRASFGRPLQYTELSTILGSATARGGLQASLPFPGQLPVTASQLFTFTPSLEASGGPQFTVNNLSSREFYQGILSPVTLAQMRLFMSRPEYRDVFLTLVVARIRWGYRDRPLVLENSPADANAFDRFRSAINALLALGLTVDRVESVTAVTPPLNPAEASDPRIAAVVAAAGDSPPRLRAYAVPRAGETPQDPNLTTSEAERLRRGLQAGATYYRLEQRRADHRLCFLPERVRQGGRRLPHPLNPSTRDFFAGENASIAPDALFTIQEADLCGSGGRASPRPVAREGDVADASRPEMLTLEFRSVQDIFHYLGRVANAARTVALEPAVREGPDRPLLVLHRSPPGGSSVSAASVDGQTRYVAFDGTDTDLTGRVIQTLLELIALNNSARDLPAPSVAPVLVR